MDTLDFGPSPETLDRYLLGSEADILTTGAPELQKWWTERIENGTLDASTLNEYQHPHMAAEYVVDAKEDVSETSPSCTIVRDVVL